MQNVFRSTQIAVIIALFSIPTACARKRDFDGNQAQAGNPIKVPNFSIAFSGEQKNPNTATFRTDVPKQVLACFKGEFLVNQVDGFIQYLGQPGKNAVLLAGVGDCTRKVRILRYDAGHNLLEDAARELDPGEEISVSLQLETGDQIELVYEEALACRADSDESAEPKNFTQNSKYAEISFGECMP